MPLALLLLLLLPLPLQVVALATPQNLIAEVEAQAATTTLWVAARALAAHQAVSAVEAQSAAI